MNQLMIVQIYMNTFMMLKFKQELYIYFKTVLVLVSFKTITDVTL